MASEDLAALEEIRTARSEVSTCRGCPMIWLLPVLPVAVTLLAAGVQRLATPRYGDACCLRRRTNHSLSLHPGAHRVAA